jgi:hypothetical protein
MNPELMQYLNSLAAQKDALPTPGGRPSAWDQMRGMAKGGAQAAVAMSPIGSIQAAQQDFASGHPIMGAINAASAALPLLKPARAARLAPRAVEAMGDGKLYKFAMKGGDEAQVTGKLHGDTFRVGFMGSTGGEGSLGVGQVREVMRAIQRETGAARVSGNRISGARPGRETSREFADVLLKRLR